MRCTASCCAGTGRVRELIVTFSGDGGCGEPTSRSFAFALGLQQDQELPT